MNRSEIRTGIRALLNEPTAGFWSDANLNSYINLANQRVNSIIAATKEDYFTVSATFSTIAATKSYTFPADCRFIRRMEVYSTSDTGDIEKLDEIRFPRTESGGEWPFPTSGRPKRYTVFGTQFNLEPIPDAVYTLRIYYDSRPDDMAQDSESPTSPVDFHDMVVYWACTLACAQNKESSEEFVGMFNLRKAELIQSLLSRGSDDPRAVEGYLEGV
jgi:hypothetical protein